MKRRGEGRSRSAAESRSSIRQLVVVGNGMVGQRFVEALRERDRTGTWRVTVLGEEPRPAYDRVALTSYLTGTTADELSLVSDGWYDGDQYVLHVGEPAATIDRSARTVTTNAGRVLPYDALVLATGSYPFVPPIPGADGHGCFTYRTIEDLDAIRDMVNSSGMTVTGAVVGGGLLGLEAAKGLADLGMSVTLLHLFDTPHFMARLGAALLLAGLVDTLRLVVAPAVLRTGRRLLAGPGASSGLRLVHHEATPTGLLLLEYETTGQAPRGEYEGVTAFV